MKILLLALGVAIGIIITLPVAFWRYKRGFAAGWAAMSVVCIDDNFELVIPLEKLYSKFLEKSKR